MTAKGLSPKKLPLKDSCRSDWILVFLSLFSVPLAKVYQRQKQTALDFRRSEIQLLNCCLISSEIFGSGKYIQLIVHNLYRIG